MVCRLNWLLRFLFPSLFIGILIYGIIGFAQENFPFELLTVFDWFMYGLGFVILYFMLFMLTVQYEISDNVLIVRSFIFRRRSFPITDILYIEKKGMFTKLSDTPFGPDFDTLHLKNGKILVIGGLSEQYKFMQLLRSKLIS